MARANAGLWPKLIGVAAVTVAFVFFSYVQSLERTLGGWSFYSLLSVCGAIFVAGGVLVFVGSVQEGRDVRRRRAERRYSWCLSCGYPFDELTPDQAELTCPECGTRFRVGDARAKYGDRQASSRPDTGESAR